MLTRATLLTALLCISLAAQQRDPARELADAALAAPPELAADALIRIAASSGTREQKIEWLERAFALAPQAKFAMRRTTAFGVLVTTDSDAGQLSAGLSAELDTMSLQSRVVRAMLPVDRERAMNMFRAILAPVYPALTCKDATVYSPEAYFQMLTAILAQGFTAEERAQGRDAEMLEGVLARIVSPFELQHTFQNLMSVRDQPAFARLLNTYAGALARIDADPRSFGATAPALVATFAMLTREAVQRNTSPYALLEAERAFLVRHLTGPRCAAKWLPAPPGVASNAIPVDQLATTFNGSIAATGADIRPITEEEAKPSRDGGADEHFEYWRTPQSAKLLTDLKNLRFGTPEQYQAIQGKRRTDGRAEFLSEVQRSEPAWEAKARDFLKDVERWQKDHTEPERDYFHMEAIMYTGLLELIPVRDLRASILRSYMTFLAQSRMRVDSPPEWFTHVNALVRMRGFSEADRDWARDEIRASGEPVMSLYLNLYALLPPASPR